MDRCPRCGSSDWKGGVCQVCGWYIPLVARIVTVSIFLSVVVGFALAAPIDEEPHDDTPTDEAPTGFDNLTNGFTPQATFDLDRAEFEEHETITSGLGPVYNDDSCVSCHANPVTGGVSQVTELRAGHFDGLKFVPHPGGSLIRDRAIDASIQERVHSDNELRGFRDAMSILGDGFVECLSPDVFDGIRANQPVSMKGEIVMVPVLEAPGKVRVGRFGWKCQHASLLSFSADAYQGELGITNPLLPTESTSGGRDVSTFDHVPDPEDAGGPNGFGKNVEQFTQFMRATRAPPTDKLLSLQTSAGSVLFDSLGCVICHVRTMRTLPAGSWINGNTFKVPDALGDKVIHPYSDYLLHDVGTGDGIVSNGPQDTANKFRTAPLWGLRTKDRLMHDDKTLTRDEAIRRHAGEATAVVDRYKALPDNRKRDLILYLQSL